MTASNINAGNSPDPFAGLNFTGHVQETDTTQGISQTQGTSATSISTLERSNALASNEKLDGGNPKVEQPDSNLLKEFNVVSGTLEEAMTLAGKMQQEISERLLKEFESVKGFALASEAAIMNAFNNGGPIDTSFLADFGLPADRAQIVGDKLNRSFEETKATTGGNPFFNPSFATAYFAIMSEVTKSQIGAKFMEYMTAIAGSKMSFEIGKTNAELTKQEYYLRAYQALSEAITAFVSAGISVVSLINSFATAKLAENKHKDDVKKLEADIKAQDKELQTIRTNSNIVLDQQTSPTPQNLKNAGMQKDALDAYEQGYNKMEKMQERLDYLKSGKGMQENIMNHSRTIGDQIKMGGDAASQFNQGVGKLFSSMYDFALADVKSTMEMNNAILGVLRNFIENSMKARDDMSNAIGQTIENMERNIRENNAAVTRMISGH